MAVEQVKERIPRGATCALIFHDRGERYLDTIYCDEWVAEHFGDIAHLWQDQPELQAGAWERRSVGAWGGGRKCVMAT